MSLIFIYRSDNGDSNWWYWWTWVMLWYFCYSNNYIDMFGE